MARYNDERRRRIARGAARAHGEGFGGSNLAEMATADTTALSQPQSQRRQISFELNFYGGNEVFGSKFVDMAFRDLHIEAAMRCQDSLPRTAKGKNSQSCLMPEKKPCFQCDGELVLKRVQKDSPNKGLLFYRY
ncbi:hypothetical protein Scep_007460 [Stephania cephalantha]|uniref:Uncharacterized protein n=1 Tax=Stephania cephalantha TaxID=152367 RepID=A0AAP0PL45_9MAGN